MTYFARVISRISRWICGVAAVSLVAIMLLTSLDVILRYLGYPIMGAYDIARLLLIIVVGFAIAYTQMVRGHIAIEFLVSRFPKRIQTIIDSIAYLIAIAVFSVLVWQLSLYGTKLWSVGQVSETILIPLAPFVYAIAFSCVMMCLILLADLANFIAQSGRK